MEIIGNVNDQIISFLEYDTAENWSSEFPTANWCLVILADEKNQNYFNEIINK
jgi:hypothetical protein